MLWAVQNLQRRTTQSGWTKGNPNQAWETQHITVIKRWRKKGKFEKRFSIMRPV